MSHYHHGNLREALLEAARGVLEETGPASLSLRDVARRAGVSPGAPYRHFKDREALLAAVATDGFHAFEEALVAAAEGAPDPLERLRRLGVEYVRFATAHPERFRVMFGDAIPDVAKHPELDGAARSAASHLHAAVTDSLEAGLLPGDSSHVPLLVSWALVHGLASLALDKQATEIGLTRENAAGLAEAVTAYVVDGLRSG